MSKNLKKLSIVSLILLTSLLWAALPGTASNVRQAEVIPPTPVAPEPYPFSERYPAVVYLEDMEDLLTLYRLEIDFEGVKAADGRQLQIGESFEGGLATVYVSPDEAEQLAQRGLTAIPIPNEGLRSFYEYGPGSEAPNAWPSFEDFVARMQGLETNFPALVDLMSIGQSVQGRDIWCMKISDNINIEEDEPEFKYTSTMHGDETTGVELTLRLAELLLNNYGSDPDLTALVDEIEIWICPIHNPDGFVSVSRFNAHGVDLNREFPDRFTDPIDDPEGHEPENQAFMYLGYNERFVMGANYHGGALVLNYPWDAVVPPGYTPVPDYAPDDTLFHDLGLGYTTLNPMIYNGGFPEGLTRGWEWYQIYGGMQDWAYYWRGEHHVTIEVSSNKRPNYGDMDTYWDNNEEAMLWWMEASLSGVRGLVLNGNDSSPISATVTVEGMELPNFARTDPIVGDYHRVIGPGSYILTASASGYQSVSHSVTVSEGLATVQDFLLYPEVDLSGSAKEASKEAALPGEMVQYQIFVHNAGTPTTVTLTDTLPLSLTWSGELTASLGTPSYVDGQILWLEALGTGESATISYSGSLTQCLPAGSQLVNLVMMRDDFGGITERSAEVTVSNQAPESPALLSPADGAVDQTQETTLSWSESEDINCDLVSYDVYLGSAMPPTLVASGLFETSYDTGELLPHTTYYWMVSASDGISESQSAIWQFTTLNHAPEAPSLPSPADGSKEQPNSLELSWVASDLDEDGLTYTLTFWAEGTQPISVSGLTETSYDPGVLAPGVTYFWQVAASDGYDTAMGEVWSFSTSDKLWTYLPLARKTSNQEP